MLRADAVEFAYGRRAVLAGISLTAAAGELVGVIGPNGAGKSTLLACLHDALHPRRGAVRLDGADLRQLPRKAIARAIGVVPQRCEVPFPVPVATFVGLGRFAHEAWLHRTTATDRRVVAATLAQMGLEQLAGRSVAELSGGEFRRALVAQALAQEPRVLLLDEPVQQLDLRHQLEVMEFARAFTRRGGTTGVVVLHELGLAARYCDRLLLLLDGRVVAEGRPEAVLTTANLRAAYGIRAAVERNASTGCLQVTAVAAATPSIDHP